MYMYIVFHIVLHHIHVLQVRFDWDARIEELRVSDHKDGDTVTLQVQGARDSGRERERER